AVAGDSTHTVEYRFDVSTSPGAGASTVVSSGWITTNSWTGVPANTLRDGATYYARVTVNYQELSYTYGSDGHLPVPGHDAAFRIELNLGKGGPSPTETAGSVPGVTSDPAQGSPSPSTPGAAATANLVDGNLAVSVPTHSVQAVGGSLAPSLV